jgi:ribosome-associated heat shock protein Hsp15
MTRRIDLWLWYARFAKTRSLAARLCGAGAITVNGTPVDKAGLVHVGDMVTVPQGRVRRIVEVRALGQRRGPPAEARELYAEARPPEPLAGAPEWERLLQE